MARSPLPLSHGVALSASAALLAYYFIHRKTKKEQKDPNNKTTTTTRQQHDTGAVSSRGRKALTPPLPYLDSFLAALQNTCDTKTNPDGFIALCTAENKLIVDHLAARLSTLEVAQKAFGEEEHFCYNDMRGIMYVKEAVARFLTRKFLKPSEAQAGGKDEGDTKKEVDGNDVILGSGCASLLNGLFFSLAEAGEAVMIPSPYYAAFESDMRVVAQCVPHQVPMVNPLLGPTVDDLNASFQKAMDRNLKPKILLLTNPNNPLGTIYSADTIRNAIEWGRERNMHIIVDEIYALSVHDARDSEFQSVIKIMDNNLGDDVHFLWALSKDFGSSGFRIGVLYTQNQVLNAALGNLNIFSAVSHPMQAVLAQLLDDEKYVDDMLDRSRHLLKSSYDTVVTTLDELEIPYVKAQACIFIYADFSSLLPEPTFEGEAKFETFMIDNARIVLTPGHCQRETKPGMFRICYAWVSPDVLEVAMARLKRVVTDVKTFGWGDDSLHQKTYYELDKS